MENNSVKSLFTWAPNTKKTGRFLGFELKADPFHSLGVREGRCHPKIACRSGGRWGFPNMRQVPVWPVGCGSITTVWGQPQEELRDPPKESRFTYTAGDSKVKIHGRKKLPPLRSKYAIQQSIKPFEHLPHLGNLQILTENRYQNQRSRKGSGFWWWWFGFFQQRQEGNKGLIPGYKRTQVQPILEEGKKERFKTHGWILLCTVVFNLGRFLTSYVIKFTEKQFLLHATEIHTLLLNVLTTELYT